MNEDATKFKELYETADRFAREVGWSQSQVSIPAHNELRYAGHHLAQAIGGDGLLERDSENFSKALNHCRRAMYEAAESGILFCLKQIQAFRETYRVLAISDVVADYTEKVKVARRAQQLVVRGRDGRTSVEEPRRRIHACISRSTCCR